MELLSCLNSVFALFDCFGAILELLITGLMMFDQMLAQYKLFFCDEKCRKQFTAAIYY